MRLLCGCYRYGNIVNSEDDGVESTSLQIMYIDELSSEFNNNSSQPTDQNEST